MKRRRAVQFISLAIFLYLIILTAYPLPTKVPTGIYRVLDPLSFLSASLAQRVWKLSLFAIPTLVLALVLGRVFCGWICPMGTVVDLSDRLLTPANRCQNPSPLKASKQLPSRRFQDPRTKYLLLIGLAFAGFFGAQWFYHLDPIPLISRLLITGVLPPLEWLTRFVFNVFYRIPGVRNVSEPFYRLLRSHVLSFRQPYFQWHWVSVVILVAVVLLSRFGRRTWCRTLCPLGALLSLFSRFAPLRINCGDACIHCGKCATHCKMGAITPQDNQTRFLPRFNKRECIVCGTCWTICPADTLTLGFGGSSQEPRHIPVDLTRRHVVGALLAGGVAAPLTSLEPLSGSASVVKAIRPPGAIHASEFHALCVRCGACMKVCPQNALHPSLWSAGVQGLFTPEIIPRLGYCHYQCNLCGTVCPTGAIRKLSRETKQRLSIGIAQFRKDRCLPYAQGINCLVCEEHCPVSPKAIQYREREIFIPHTGETALIKEPYVVAERCIGCGICENVCPLEGSAGVAVHPRLEQAQLDESPSDEGVSSPY